MESCRLRGAMNQDQEHEIQRTREMAETLWTALERINGSPEESVEALVLCMYNVCSANGIEYPIMARQVIDTWNDMSVIDAK